jgi:hypothetical protein
MDTTAGDSSERQEWGGAVSSPRTQHAAAPASVSAAPLLPLPIIPDQEQTPTVLRLLAIIAQLNQRLAEQDQRLAEQDQRLAELTAAIARLKGDQHKPRSNSKPSGLPKSPPPPDAPGKRPGSAKRSKTAELTIHQEVVLPPKDLPAGATLLSRDPFVVQDLVIEVRNTRYLLETWQTPTGERLRGTLPAGIRGHYGPGLIGFVLQQHYQAHVPQPRILEELCDRGIDISAGQINHLVTAEHTALHAEKEALLPAALQASTYVNVDDSGAPHQGHYGSCLCISNDFFTSFHSSDRKSRSKFLDVLRCGHQDYVLNEAAWSYLERQDVPAKLRQQLQAPGEQVFADVAAWEQHLEALAVAASYREPVTEAALLGSAVAHGVPVDLGIVSDGAATYALFVHGLCWVHQERNLAKLVPSGPEQAQAKEEVLTAVWQLYADLNAYRAAPAATQAEVLRGRFDALVGRTTCFAELNAALARMAAHRAELLRVLDRPDMPLHSNRVEQDFRDWATKRKISAGTRSERGRRCRDTFLSLKATCKKLGLRFWAYLQDRLVQAGTIPYLPDLVRAKAAGSATI